MFFCIELTDTAFANPYPETQYLDGDAYVEVRCTYFAWQCAYERMGIELPIWGNAVDWWQGAVNDERYSTGSTPKADSIAVWSGDGGGHVAYVTSGSGSTFTVDEGGRTDLDHTSSRGVKYGYTITNAVGAPRPYDPGKILLGFIYLSAQPVQCELDFNDWTDNADNGGVANYATFDMYLNGSRVADDVNDFCQGVSPGTTYEIKDIKVVDGKVYGGLSNRTRDGVVSGGPTSTVNANTDVRLTLFTVDPPGWLSNNSPAAISVYDGHSYYFYSTPATWYGAKIVSEYRGGHLVTITSSAENAHVKSMIGNSACWIGATDKGSEGTWKWVNGEIFSFSNWSNSQPDNNAGNNEGTEDFAHICSDADTWNDNAGYVVYPFVCEIDRAYTVTYNVTKAL